MSPVLLAQAKEIKGSYLHELLTKRNVVGVGLGYKVSDGHVSDELSVVVSVTHKVDRSALAPDDLVPETLNGVTTDVVETGVFRAFQLSPRDRWRPQVPPGTSIGHVHITAGTFGCLVRRGQDVFILSNNHVLADINSGRIGDAILQPGPADGGTAADSIATLEDFIPLDFGTAPADCPVARWSVNVLNLIAGVLRSSHHLEAIKATEGVNAVDAALARPIPRNIVIPEILEIGTPIGTGPARLGMAVQKSGRTTGYTQGTVTQVEATVRVDYQGPTALFNNQIIAGPMSGPGDSGSAVLDMDRHVVGLLFAGSNATTIMNPIDAVLSALDVEMVV